MPVPSLVPHTWVAGDDATSGNLQTLTDWENFLRNPPRARAWQSVAQTIATGTVTALTFTNEDVDTEGIHSQVTNTSRMTIVSAGRYRVIAGCGIAGNATGTRTLRITKNGATIAAVRLPGNATAAQIMQLTEEILCVAGDYIEVTIQQDSGVGLATSATTDTCYLHVVWVSGT